MTWVWVAVWVGRPGCSVPIEMGWQRMSCWCRCMSPPSCSALWNSCCCSHGHLPEEKRFQLMQILTIHMLSKLLPVPHTGLKLVVYFKTVGVVENLQTQTPQSWQRCNCECTLVTLVMTVSSWLSMFSFIHFCRVCPGVMGGLLFGLLGLFLLFFLALSGDEPRITASCVRADGRAGDDPSGMEVFIRPIVMTTECNRQVIGSLNPIQSSRVKDWCE